MRQEQLDRAAAWKTSEAREVERWRTIVGEVLHDVTEVEACFAALYDHFSQARHWRCDPSVPAIFAALADRGCRVAVASNFDQRLRRVAAGLPRLAALADIVISSEVGWRKPAPEFFAAVCAALLVEPAEVLYIGDDLVNDYKGALAVGWRAVVLDPAGRMPREVSTIRETTAVLDWIGDPANQQS